MTRDAWYFIWWTVKPVWMTVRKYSQGPTITDTTTFSPVPWSSETQEGSLQIHSHEREKNQLFRCRSSKGSLPWAFQEPPWLEWEGIFVSIRFINGRIQSCHRPSRMFVTISEISENLRNLVSQIKGWNTALQYSNRRIHQSNCWEISRWLLKFVAFIGRTKQTLKIYIKDFPGGPVAKASCS